MSFLRAGEENSDQFAKIYNGQNWLIQIDIINFKRDIIATLITQNINQIILCNDIECYSPTLEVTYFDIGQNVSMNRQ